jgi:hypothetical protein
MGTFDSSESRVVPVFDRLVEQSSDGSTWIHRLLTLPRHGATQLQRPPSQRIVAGTRTWGRDEVSLDAPRSILEWLIRNLETPRRESDLGDGKTLEKRRALIARDPTTTAEALERLEETRRRAWHVLEGPSHPDAFLDTDRAVIVIEGKRTEVGPTSLRSLMNNPG